MSAARNIVNKSLKAKIIDLIRYKGPMTVADYMKIVLTNPESGFYMNDDVFGVKGHFTTNPEISQTFGEILGAWVLHEWRRFGCAKPMRLVEFGPGRGTLMSDMVRTIGQLESSIINDDEDEKSLKLSMIEMSPRLQAVQQETLSKNQFTSDLVKRTQWFSHIDALPKSDSTGFTAYIAHEYIDALPIYKFVSDPKSESWRDLLIDYDAKENLRFCISNRPSLSSRLLVPENFQGEHIEVCPEGALQLEKVAKRLEAAPNGCMLICDYGFEEGSEDSKSNPANELTKATKLNRDTFRAFRNHEPWAPLSEPGTADLTADVDFGYLKRNLADKALLFGSVNQRQFLLACGLQARLKVLLDNCATTEARNNLISGADMMLSSMGERYRMLAMFPKASERLFGADPPAGFSTQQRSTESEQ